MINIFPVHISSSQLVGVVTIPSVFGISSSETVGTPNIPSYAGITSQEALGAPTVGIWWLHWREFDTRNLFVRQHKVFSTTVERYQYAESLMTEMVPKYAWKFKPMVFGRPILPKAKVWDHRDIYIRDSLR